MKYRKLGLGLVVAAGLVIPAGFASPALATNDIDGYGIVEEPAAPPLAAAPQASSGAANSESANRDADAGARTAAAAAPKPKAAATKSTFGNAKAAKPSSTTVSSKKTPAKKKIKVTFDGPAPDSSGYIRYNMYNSKFYGPTVKNLKRSKGVTASVVAKPYIDGASGNIKPSAASYATISAYRYTTPGSWQASIPVMQSKYDPATGTTKRSVKYAKVTFTVRANTKNSRAETYFSGSARAKKTFPVAVTAPNYQAGATVKVYYKAKGTKSYKKVGKTMRLKAKGKSYTSKVTVKVPAKYNMGGRGGSVKVKIGSVAYATGYTSKVAKLKRY